MKISRLQLFAFLITVPFLLNCGGGGGGGSSSSPGSSAAPTPTATMTGTVSGTTVIAYNLSNVEIARNTASGIPKTFTLSLPTGVSYKLYFVENEGTLSETVFPLYSGSTNVFTIGSQGTIDMGFVDTSSGFAVPTNDPLSFPGVASAGEDTTIPAGISGSAISQSDWADTEWYVHGLTAGQTFMPGWYRGSISVDNSGVFSFQSIVDSAGLAPTSRTLSVLNIVMPSGILTPTMNLGRFMMTRDKQTLIGIDTFYPAINTSVRGYNLMIAQRKGGTFATSDLAGTWQTKMLSSGANTQWIGWMHGSLSIDSSGLATYGALTFSDGSSHPIGNHSFVISSDGVVTTNPSACLGEYNGVMSQNKNLIIATKNMPGEQCDLWIYMKTANSYSAADLEGSWKIFGLVVGINADWQGWLFGEASLDIAGSITWSHITRSNGNSTLPTGPTGLSVDLNGIVTSTFNPTLHGVISYDKKMMVITMDDSGGGYNMLIFQR